MQSTFQLAIAAQFDEDDFVERKAHEIERLVHRIGARIFCLGHGRIRR